jgi:hypothetical protein
LLERLVKATLNLWTNDRLAQTWTHNLPNTSIIVNYSTVMSEVWGSWEVARALWNVCASLQCNIRTHPWSLFLQWCHKRQLQVMLVAVPLGLWRIVQGGWRFVFHGKMMTGQRWKTRRHYPPFHCEEKPFHH